MSTTIVDAFAGVGGLALGWMNLDGRPVRHLGAIDSDGTLRSCYEHNFPGVSFINYRFGDPFSTEAAREMAGVIDKVPGPVSVLLAAPPCQPFSAAGKRNNVGADAYLAVHACTLAECLDPEIVIMENVPQFGRVMGGNLAGRIRVRLRRAGFATTLITLDALRFGVPQRRARTLLLGARARARRLAVARKLEHAVSKLQEEQNYRGQRLYITVSDAISDLPALKAGGGSEEVEIISKPLSDYQRILRKPDGCTYNHTAANHSPELVERMRTVHAGEVPQNCEEHVMRRKQYFRLAYARLSADAPAATLTTNTHNPGSGRFIHYRDHRTLTVREVARLQGFPDWFRFIGLQTVQRRHVGNAVPPPLSRRIAEVLTEVGI